MSDACWVMLRGAPQTTYVTPDGTPYRTDGAGLLSVRVEDALPLLTTHDLTRVENEPPPKPARGKK